MWADRGEKLDQALEMITRAVKESPDNGAYVDSLGWVYFRMGDLEKARQMLLDAVRLLPDDATVQEHLGDVLAKLGQVDDALARYKTALNLEPTPEDEAEIRSKITEMEKRLASSSIQ